MYQLTSYTRRNMNISLAYPIRDKKSTGVGNLAKGTILETLRIDKKNRYILSDDQYFDSDLRPFSNIRWGGYEQECLRFDFMCYCKNVDILHSYWNPLEHMKSKCIKIYTIYDLIPLIHPEWHTLKEYFEGPIRETALMADMILTDSEHTRKDVIEYYHILPEKVKTVYPGLSHTLDFSQKNIYVLDKFHIQDDYIMSVSTIEPRKNLRGLINGFISYKQSHPHSKLKLVLVGKKGWDNEFEKDISKIDQYRDNIILTGFVSDEELSSLYQYALAVAYVSFYEGFGLPLLEALTAGKAVISSNVTSMPEVCGNAACYCNPYDIDSIEDAIEKVVNNESYRKSLERDSIIQAAKFSYQKAAEETVDIYNSFGGKNNAG